MNESVLRLPQVLEICGLSRSSIYSMMKDGSFEVIDIDEFAADENKQFKIGSYGADFGRYYVRWSTLLTPCFVSKSVLFLT